MRRFVLSFAAALIASTAGAQPDPVPGTPVPTVDPAALPAPGRTPIASNPARRVYRPDGALPRAPEGFTVSLFADGLDHARWLAAASDGTVFVAEGRAGAVTLLKDTDDYRGADRMVTFADGFNRPSGLLIDEAQGALFVADLEGLWRLDWRPGQTGASGGRTRITPPDAFGDRYGHWTRVPARAPDGGFYVAIGSRTNASEDPPPFASIQHFSADGRTRRTVASGLRNPVGLAVEPETGALYTVVNERDGLGDGLVPDYLTAVRQGGFYGWPYTYIGDHPQPGLADRKPDGLGPAIVPDLLFQSHSAPLGLLFHSGIGLPADYKGDAFVALHGSWNAADPRGYMVVRVRFADGRPTGAVEAFLTGFRLTDTSSGAAQVWGRPVGLAELPDGSLLVADDVGQRIWRVTWTGR